MVRVKSESGLSIYLVRPSRRVAYSPPGSTYALLWRLIRWRSLVNIWSTDRYETGFLPRSDRPVGCLPCPARFERATYALEALKMS